MVSKAYPEFLPGYCIALLLVSHGLGHLTWCCYEEKRNAGIISTLLFPFIFMISVAGLRSIVFLWPEGDESARKCLEV